MAETVAYEPKEGSGGSFVGCDVKKSLELQREAAAFCGRLLSGKVVILSTTQVVINTLCFCFASVALLIVDLQ